MSNDNGLLPIQQAYKQAHRRRTAADTERARAKDAQSHATLKRLMKHDGNMHCADCTSVHAGWGVLPHGVFVCIDCAQIHRLIGKHVSQTKGINTNTYLWHDDEIDVMKALGNKKANGALLANHPDGSAKRVEKNAPQREKERFVRQKYENLQWFCRPTVEIGCTTSRSTHAKKTAKMTGPTGSESSTPQVGDLISFDEDCRATEHKKPEDDFFAQFDISNAQPAKHTPIDEQTHTSQPSQPSKEPTREQLHASKASKVMEAFRQNHHQQQFRQSNLRQQVLPPARIDVSPLKPVSFNCQGFVPQQEFVPNTFVAQKRPEVGVYLHSNKNDPFNTGFFESFGLPASH